MVDTWDSVRKNVGRIESVISLIQQGPAHRRGKCDMPYRLEPGKQRRASIRGEGKIEKQLLSDLERLKECILLKNGKKLNSIYFLSNAFGIGAKRRGNVIVDLFGLDKKGSPVCGEVKITSANPWSAVVQCAEQVALLRSDRKFFMENIKAKFDKTVRGAGAWGLVIAPIKYWNKEEAINAKELVETLRRKTKVRICCVAYDGIVKNNQFILQVVFGLPPYAR